MASNVIIPPRLEPSKYESWRKEMRIWQMATSVPKPKQAPTVFLSLTGKAREAVLEMDPEDLNDEEGMEKLYTVLDRLYKVDANLAALRAYERFEKYSRASEINMADYQIEFDRLVQQLREHKIGLPDPVLAYRALKGANLTEENERLILATVNDITLNDMMIQLRKVMDMTESDKVKLPKEEFVAVRIKHEPDIAFADSGKDENNEVFYNTYRRGQSYRRSRGGGRGDRSRAKQGARTRNFSERGYHKKCNPPGPDGSPSKCAVCASIMHWVRDCPHAEKGNEKDDKVYEAQIVLINLEDIGNEKTTLLGQTVGSTILDSGCSKSVCGYVWYKCFMDTLSEYVQKRIKKRRSESVFRFGNGSEIKSMFNVNLPCVLAGKEVEINVDVINSEIPLLLSKKAMKKANTVIDFENDVVWIFGKKQKLQCTDSGHYYVPLSKSLSNISKVKEVLFVKKLESKSKNEKTKIAEKLHKQFSHPSTDKMCTLVKNSGVRDTEFFDILKEIPSKCDICVRYKRIEPKPIVGFPLSSRFNETVAMDIKEIRGNRVLHIIDHATRYSVAVRIKSKEASEIIGVIFRFWISYFGAPDTFLTDNGREFNNSQFRDMAQNLNIVVRTTAAQSPWSNGLNERHNGILSQMVVKTMEDVGCTIDDALGWAVSAKNSLHNINGFSPNQLVFGYNPNVPTVLINQLPALEAISTSEIVANNLNALHAARRAFIQAESSEKLQRALRHQVRSSTGIEFTNGDLVYFKRNGIENWMGPGTVIGSENKQILVKHGGTYVRVHPCRIQRYYGTSSEILSDNMNSMENNSCDSLVKNVGDQFTGFSKQTTSEDFNEDAYQEEPQVTINANGTDETNTPQRNFNSVKPKVTLPKPGQSILCKMSADGSDDTWKKMKVISKGGKATGKNKHIMNVSVEGDNPFWLDFEHGVTEWKIDEETTDSSGDALDEDVCDTMPENVYFSIMPEDEVFHAKKSELNSWKDNHVYTEVLDAGQNRIDTRWIYTNKETTRGKVIKARLVAKGFQDPDARYIRSDSPTCAKESLRIVLSIMTSFGWSINSLDIKTAFLQGKSFDRTVFVTPPVEADKKQGTLWKLNKCVYGLNDASRVWYLTVKEELIKLGARVSKYDQAVFTFHCDNNLQGIISTHVDDFCWAGTEQFASKVISRVRNTFKVKSEEKVKFKYLGLDLIQDDSRIIIKQDEFTQTLNLIPMRKQYSSDTCMTDMEVTACRSALGKLNWLATHSRPDLCYEVSEHTSMLKHRCVDSIIHINKTIRKAKRESSHVIVPNLGKLNMCSIIAYSDASFTNLSDGGSQGGYIIFLVGKNGKSVPVSWQSRRVKRVVKSTQAAETLAMVDTAEACVYYKKFIMDLLAVENQNCIPIHCRTDNAALHESVHSSTQILDKRLRIETAILREMHEKGEVTSFQWVPGTHQLADSLTKTGVPSRKILSHMTGQKEF